MILKDFEQFLSTCKAYGIISETDLLSDRLLLDALAALLKHCQVTDVVKDLLYTQYQDEDLEWFFETECDGFIAQSMLKDAGPGEIDKSDISLFQDLFCYITLPLINNIDGFWISDGFLSDSPWDEDGEDGLSYKLSVRIRIAILLSMFQVEKIRTQIKELSSTEVLAASAAPFLRFSPENFSVSEEKEVVLASILKSPLACMMALWVDFLPGKNPLLDVSNNNGALDIALDWEWGTMIKPWWEEFLLIEEKSQELDGGYPPLRLFSELVTFGHIFKEGGLRENV